VDTPGPPEQAAQCPHPRPSPRPLCLLVGDAVRQLLLGPTLLCIARPSAGREAVITGLPGGRMEGLVGRLREVTLGLFPEIPVVRYKEGGEGECMRYNTCKAGRV
jgi:hypothetical protein